MPNWNPFSGDFWSKENWFGKEYNPQQYNVNEAAYGTGAAGQRMQDLLESQARGEGPSLGRSVMQQGLEQAIKNQRAQAAGMMGTNPALAMKLSGEQAGAATAQNLKQAGMVGMQEQRQAQAALQDWIQQQRAAQIQLEQQKAFQNNLYQQQLMQQAANNQGIFSDVAGMLGSGLGMGAAAGWFGQGMQNFMGGGGQGGGYMGGPGGYSGYGNYGRNYPTPPNVQNQGLML